MSKRTIEIMAAHKTESLERENKTLLSEAELMKFEIQNLRSNLEAAHKELEIAKAGLLVAQQRLGPNGYKIIKEVRSLRFRVAHLRGGLVELKRDTELVYGDLMEPVIKVVQKCIRATLLRDDQEARE